MAEVRCLTGTSILVLRDTAARLGEKPLAGNCLWSLESDVCICLVWDNGLIFDGNVRISRP